MPRINYASAHHRHTHLIQDYITRAKAKGQRVFIEEAPCKPLTIRWLRSSDSEHRYHGERAFTLLRAATQILKNYPAARINLLDALLFVLPNETTLAAKAA